MAIDFEPLTDAPKIDFEPESSPAAPQIDFQPESSPVAVTAEPDMPTSDAGPAPAPSMFQATDYEGRMGELQKHFNEVVAPARARLQQVGDVPVDFNVETPPAVQSALDTYREADARLGRMQREIQAMKPGTPAPILDENGQEYTPMRTELPVEPSPDQTAEARRQEQIKIYGREPGAIETLAAQTHSVFADMFAETMRTFAPSGLYGSDQVQEAEAMAHDSAVAAGLNKSVGGDIARGTADVLALMSGNPEGKAGIIAAALKGAATAKNRVLDETGDPNKANAAALNSIITLPLLLATGSAASKLAGKLLPEEAGAVAKGAAEFGAGTTANVGTDLLIHAVEGQPYDWRSFTADALFALHGAWSRYREAALTKGDTQAAQTAQEAADTISEEIKTKTGETPNAIENTSTSPSDGGLRSRSEIQELPATESSQGVQPSGQGNGNLEQGVARSAPSEAQPKIVSTAIDVGNGNFITGKEWNSPHTELTKEAIATNPEIVDDLMDQNSARRGFIVEDPNGQQRFVDRKEAYTIAGEAGQRAVENSKGELNSQDLQSPVAPEASVPSPPERNLGPGAPNIEEFVPPPEIGAWNAKVDEQRGARGLPPLASEARKPDPVLWDTTMGKIEREVIKPEEIVNDVLSNKKKIATDEEQTALLYRMVDLHNKLDTEAQRYLDPSNNDAERAEAKLNYDRLEREFQRTEEADRKVGTEQGRALRARRLIADENYNLVGIMRRLSMAKGEGKPITPEEVQKAKEGAAAVKTAADELEEVTTRGPVDESIRQIEEEAKKNPEFTPQVRSLADRIIERLDRAGKAALARLQELRAQMGSAPDVSKTAAIIKEFSILAASDIGKGILHFGKWVTSVVERVGDWSLPYLEKAWQQADKDIDKHVAATVEPKNRKAVKEAITRKGTAATADTITEEMKGKKPEELRSSVHKLMETLVRSGVKGREPLVDAVHERLKEVDPSISRRQTMDLMSGYGNLKKLNPDAVKAEVRDIKQQLQLVAKIQDVLAKIPLKKSGVERQALSDESRRLTQELNENIRKLGVVVSDPETQLKTILAAQETRLTNRIKDLRQEIADGERRVKTKTQAPTNEKIEALKKELAQVEVEHEKVLGKDEQRKINTILASLKKRTADLQAKAAAGDFTKPPPRKASPITPEILKARAKLEDAKTVIDRGIEKERLKNRTFWEKGADLTAKITRANILSGPVTLAKLTTAAAYRVASIPAEEVAGSALKKLFPRAAARAPYEGRGLEPRLEAQSIAKGVTRGLMDAWNTVKSGKGQLDTALGKRDITPRSLLDIFGAIHGALKAPVKRVFFERSMAKRVRSAAEAGVDVTDPAIQVQIAADAYKDAQRSIFMQDNKVASLVSQMAARLEAPKKTTGRPSTLGKAGATALRIALPVVKVPTNIVAEIFQHVFGLPYGLGKLAREYARGIEKLHPDEADAIFRSMKKGSLGTAMLLYGFFAPNQFGGQYAPGLKKKEDEAGFGEMKVGGAKVPKFLIHNPLLETAQVGATIRHVMDQKIKGKTQGLMTGIGRGLLGAVEEAPQFDEAVRLSHLTEQNGPTKYFGELARSVAIPQLVQQIARWTDAQKRKPETITDYLKEGIPGARETLPVRR